ncbi:LOW QUALITY PROTEIN: fucose-1-phosphate guanylyltransferase-like [Uloborus diversus]|uniref:LOW QUALITY PROTEIN: fucose-1-phosphate guanylyltransferase-like n=1 Tax=Uloborus diversus TaxID=327109 RepID=UPI00240914E4|nr:LOW QUALITY PROTEIN: fucose-1-phosphate guanylyltransferase-like [Uloborus diversus]
MIVTEKREKIFQYMKKVLCNYEELRGKQVNTSTKKQFWDAVIISACDSDQKFGYEMQILLKQQKGELPLNVSFHVFADPPDFKIGCGGSTMFVLAKVFEMYGNAMLDMRLLIIPAGGYSQRLPNLSALGKLFCPLPFGQKNYQMLDLVLAIYLPFLKRMKPGVFLASSDAVISYYIADDDVWNFENEGFTALAHPSPVPVGTSHGVYVLPSMDSFECGSTFMSECLRVLQKPTVQEMHEKNAIIKKSLGSEKEEEIIYSDSAFYFDHNISMTLIKFYNTSQPLKCELSSYGDFLQPLGLHASPTYIMEKLTSEELAETRSALYRNLFGTKLSIFVLEMSDFHHLGSMNEYVESFCFKNKFCDAFPMLKFSCSSLSVPGISPFYIHGTILHSRVHPLSVVPESSVLEYCDLNVAVDVGENCIISNVRLNGYPVQKLPFQVPNNTLLHTAAFKDGFVTVSFGINDDIKETFSFEKSLEIKLLGKKLSSLVKSSGKLFELGCNDCSLWNAQLFPLCNSPEESLKKTLELILCIQQGEDFLFLYSSVFEHTTWLSMNDVLCLKDAEKMIAYQKALYCKNLGKFVEI